ncbi:MAG TPA: carbohydrate ABC transporter permease [Bacteroidota bacterium]|nr:carbohydrate ABC transporter permease [Bacteroidota bacterium]
MGRSLRTGVRYLLLVAVAIVMVGPFLWMVSTSMMDEADIFRFPPRWLPPAFSLRNYRAIMDVLPLGRMLLNSFTIAVCATVGQLLSCALAAYAFARMKFRGQSVLYFTLLATMMIPPQVTMIPVFLIMRFLGLIDTLYALIVPAFFGGAFGTFLLRQFFATIPPELEDAARIDGCGRFRIFWRIVLPLSRPALVTLALFTFMAYWNDLLGPVIYLSSVNRATLTIGLANLQSGVLTTRYDLLMAGSVLSVLPILVLFVAGQRWFVRGIAMTGLRE